MSRKLATTIKDSAIPGKYKRVLEAYAAFANNDGTNIYPVQEKLGNKAGCSVDTIGRQTKELLLSTVLRRADKHTCKVKGCSGGSTHYCGYNGKWTNVYEIELVNLQNAANHLTAICGKARAAKCRKPSTAICGTDSGIKETPAPRSSELGKTPDSFVSHEPIVSELVSRTFPPTETEIETLELGSEETATPTPQDEDPICVWSEGRQDYIGEEEVIRELRDSFPLFKSTVTPTSDDMRLMAEIIIRADGYCILPSEAVKYAIKHKQNAPGLIPRTVKQFHKAVFEGDSMAGLLAQTKEHDPEKCGLCLKELQSLPCNKCHGTTWGKPTIEYGKPFCQDCMKLAPYRRHSGERSILMASDI
jgi:hypothetical protein